VAFVVSPTTWSEVGFITVISATAPAAGQLLNVKLAVMGTSPRAALADTAVTVTVAALVLLRLTLELEVVQL
jgi:hypothetical protein